MKLISCFLCLVISVSTVLSCNEGTVYCYWSSWSVWLPGVGSFGVSDLPHDLCTHIVYTFVTLDEGGNIFYDKPVDYNGKSNSFAELAALKQKNPHLKLIATIGGYGEGPRDFSSVAEYEWLRYHFVSNVLRFLKDNHFDGLDVMWHYPAIHSRASDKQNLVLLLKELKKAFAPEGFELSAAVGVTSDMIDTSYDVPAINDIVDRIVLMTYDYHGEWEKTTGVGAPLYPQVTDHLDSQANVAYAVQRWISAGATPSKLLLSMPLYGKTFLLRNLAHTSTGAPAVSGGPASEYTFQTGFNAYYEICLDQLESPEEWSVTEVINNYVYANKGRFWVGYDNPSTIKAKGAYARSNGLGGFSVWALESDDFSGECGGGTYPLLRSAIEGWCGAEHPETNEITNDVFEDVIDTKPYPEAKGTPDAKTAEEETLNQQDKTQDSSQNVKPEDVDEENTANDTVNDESLDEKPKIQRDPNTANDSNDDTATTEKPKLTREPNENEEVVCRVSEDNQEM